METRTNPAPMPELPADVGRITPSQKKALTHLWEYLVWQSSMLHFNPEKYEVKEWRVYRHNSSFSGPSRWLAVIAEVGLKGDEGTLASSLCRDRFHVFVGVNGNMSAYTKSKRAKHGSKRVSIRRYGYLPKQGR